MPVGTKAEKAGKKGSKDRAIFQLYSLGIATNRDEWAFDKSIDSLKDKSAFFAEIYNSHLNAPKNKKFADFDMSIKWNSELEGSARKGNQLVLTAKDFGISSYRPFVSNFVNYHPLVIHRYYAQNRLFPKATSKENNSLNIYCINSNNPLAALTTNQVPDLGLLKQGNGGTFSFPRYRYSKSGEKIDNITDWALGKFREAYAPPSPLRGGIEGGGRAEGANLKEDTPTGSAVASSASPASPQGGGSSSAHAAVPKITKDDIFCYVYGVLHDPVYRETYAINLKREFPRIPFYPDFHQWAAWGKRLMAFHIGYEKVEPWPLERLDTPDEKAREGGVSPKAMLKADKDNHTIRLDTETQLSGIPPEVWDYKLGNRSALEWILDQYKEKTPRDPTIREKFNTYRFADYKEHVIDLLMRVTRVSVETIAITEAMKEAKRG